MTRLVDYFAIYGYDPEKARNTLEISCSRLVQRFPEKDWPDTPFIEDLGTFCQPNGWNLSAERQEPKFFISVLTAAEGNRIYCPIFTFSEAVPKEDLEVRSVDEDEGADGGKGGGGMSMVTLRGSSLPRPPPVIRSSTVSLPIDDSVTFAPKCLIFLSRYDMPDLFRNCLGLIYTVYVERMTMAGGEPIRLETLVGNLLGKLSLPDPTASSPLKFSLGANDRQVVQPALYPDLPVTGARVALLFQQLGINNVLTLFCAVLTEQKILLHSESFARLTDSSLALTSLIYPLKYRHTLVPILPSSILEVLNSPTPYIMGVHSINKDQIVDHLDVIQVDLDGGCISIPQNMVTFQVMEPLLSRVQHELSLVLHPELGRADAAFGGSPASGTADKHGGRSIELLDKELRAVVLRLMVQLLQGYRGCLTLVRIHPRPYIAFHKAAFLGMRNLSQDCDFISRFLNCMFFNEFVSSRGPPWRLCDIFDELYADIGEQMARETADQRLVLQHVQDLAKKIFDNENYWSTHFTNGQNLSERIPLPTEGHMMRVHQPIFPWLDKHLVQSIIDEGQSTRQLRQELSPSNHSSQYKLVPMGQKLTAGEPAAALSASTPNSARKLEVLRACIANIFENKISEAKKTFPAVIRALKSKDARLALCEELGLHVKKNQVTLEHQQFDLVVRLLNAALQDDSDMDMYGVAAAILPLASAFCRKLPRNVTQFAYTLIQDHAVWQNQLFWEAAFYSDVQKGIKDLYLVMDNTEPDLEVVSAQLSVEKHVGPRAREVRKSALLSPEDPSVLEIAASEMKKWRGLCDEDRRARMVQEEQTVFSLATHYTNTMVFVLIPMDYKPHHRNDKSIHDYQSDLVSNSISNSVAESDSIDAESGFDDTEPTDNCPAVIKFLTKFVDKVCSESSVTDSHLKALHQMIPGTVALHMETLDAVSIGVKGLPPIHKPKFHTPTLLPGEVLVPECTLRSYLLIDGRDEHAGVSGPGLLPAEGALFLTNYRLIFKGNPIDPYSNEKTIVRSFPVTSIIQEKRFSMHEYLSEIDQVLKEGIQLRSSTFQLIRAAFDDEVTPDQIEKFKGNIRRTQYQQHHWYFYTFRGYINSADLAGGKDKDKSTKYSTIRGFAKSTLKNVSKATGLKTKSSKKSSKFPFSPNVLPAHGRLSIADLSVEPRVCEDDELSVISDHVPVPPHPTMKPGPLDSKGLERLGDKLYYKDWERLGLGSLESVSLKSTTTAQPAACTRITVVNHKLTTCKSYPQLLVVPGRISDDSIRRLTRLYRQNRLPVVTWRHPVSRSFLLRGSSFQARGVKDLFMRASAGSAGGAGGSDNAASHEVPSSAEADEYLKAVIVATPASRPGADGFGAQWTSCTSLLSESAAFGPITTPTMSRRSGGGGGSAFSRAMEGFGTLTRSSGSGALRGSYRSSGESEADTYSGVPSATLYIFIDKSHAKGARVESHPKAQFVPVEYPDTRKLRHSFKKLRRACHPSSVSASSGAGGVSGSSGSDRGFLALVEDSEWLVHLQTVIKIAGAVTDLMESSSVILSLEDGWDLTCQVSSIAQICMDPYYRTIQGFRVLIEKEWLAFGHRFNYRSNLTNSNPDGGFTPVFLQFLDIVHQLHTQFPMSFEFSQYYLKFLAFHYVSCRFETFLFDSEEMRSNNGFSDLHENSRSTIGRSTLGGGISVGSRSYDTVSSDEDERGGNGGTLGGHHVSNKLLNLSVFDYIDQMHEKRTLMFNTLYCPELQQSVLRPFSNLSDLVLWDYYTHENLGSGPEYDVEYAELDANLDQGGLDPGVEAKIVMQGYDDMSREHMDSISHLFKEISDLEARLGLPSSRWSHHWDSLEVPPALPPPPPPQHANAAVSSSKAVVTTPSMYARKYGRDLHRLATLDLLKMGVLGHGAGGLAGEAGGVGGGGGTSYSHPHRFEKFNNTTPTYCDVCNQVLWGIVRTGSLRCQDCGLNCHEKCRDQVSKACTKYKSVPRDPTSDNIKGDAHRPPVNGEYFPVPSKVESSNIIYQGGLYKRGGLMKVSWKLRWFVLDSIQHQLRYYDHKNDPHLKGVIDLSEVRGVCEGTSMPGAPKKMDERCFFNLQTSQRNYSFCAETPHQAMEWQEKIQSCLS